MKTTTHRGANHVLHIFLTIVTCGMWAITGWPIAAMMGRKTTVDTQYFPPQYPAGMQPMAQQNQYYPPQPVQWPAAPTAYTSPGTPTHPIPNNPYTQGP